MLEKTLADAANEVANCCHGWNLKVRTVSWKHCHLTICNIFADRVKAYPVEPQKRWLFLMVINSCINLVYRLFITGVYGTKSIMAVCQHGMWYKALMAIWSCCWSSCYSLNKGLRHSATCLEATHWADKITLLEGTGNLYTVVKVHTSIKKYKNIKEYIKVYKRIFKK